VPIKSNPVSIKLNEVCAEGRECDGHSDFIEVFNPETSPVDLSAYLLRNRRGNRLQLSGQLGPRQYLAWGRDQLGFSVSKDGDEIELVFARSSGEQVVDRVAMSKTAAFAQRVPDGGDWETLTHDEIHGHRNRVGSRGGPNVSVRH
jgi:hypothetical protein